jgi:hypothetical protein
VGKTEAGAWQDFGATESENGKITAVTLSFPIPLKENPTPHYITLEEVEASKVPAGCKGNVEKPEADPGNLCVFEANPKLYAGVVGPGEGTDSSEEPTFIDTSSSLLSGKAEGVVGPTGGLLKLIIKTEVGTAFAYGSWVVTASK